MAKSTRLFDWDGTSTPIVDRELLNFSNTDTGLGEAFAYLFGDLFRFIKEKQAWVKFDGVRWRPAEEVVHKRMVQAIRSIKETARAFLTGDENTRTLARIERWTFESEAVHKIKAGLVAAEKLLSDSINDFDISKWVLACENEAIDLKTGNPVHSSPDNMLYRSNGIKWVEEPAAHFGQYGCKRWIQFLGEVFAGDQDLIDFVQKAVGYTLTGDVSEQCFFLLHGLGANGKSVFLTILEKLMGEYGIVASSSTFMEQSNDNIPNDIARMAGARFVKSVEVREMSQFNIEKMKALTGGDKISARFLHAEYFDFNPVAKFWMAVNHKPNVTDPTYSFWRRTHEIPFNVTFPPDKQDRHLIDKLTEELPYILNWAIVGCDRWQTEGLVRPEAIEIATKEYMNDMDSVGGFVEERVEEDLTGNVKASVLYGAYQAWCEQNGYRPVSVQTFGVTLKARGFKKEKQGNKRIRYYLGIRLAAQ